MAPAFFSRWVTIQRPGWSRDQPFVPRPAQHLAGDAAARRRTPRSRSARRWRIAADQGKADIGAVEPQPVRPAAIGFRPVLVKVGIATDGDVRGCRPSPPCSRRIIAASAGLLGHWDRHDLDGHHPRPRYGATPWSGIQTPRRWVAGLPEHVDRHAAARIEVAADAEPVRLQEVGDLAADRHASRPRGRRRDCGTTGGRASATSTRPATAWARSR